MSQKLHNAVQQIFSQDNKLDIRNIKYLPRWAILVIDLGIVVVAGILTVLVMRDLTNNFYSFFSMKQRMSLAIAVNLIFFFVYRTYAGLIRHSSFVDAFKLMLACFSTFITLVLINYTTLAVLEEKIFLVAELVFYFLFSFSLLFLFRLSVKQVYEYFKQAQKNEGLRRVMIFGTDGNAVSIAGALEIEHPQRFKVIGFVTRDASIRNIRILDKQVIYKDLNLCETIKNLGANALILSQYKLSAEEKLELVEDCLENGIQVFNAPLISDYQNEGSVSNKIRSLEIEDLLNREPILLNQENKREQLTGKTILVTGGAGSIGGEIVRQVAHYNPKLLIILDQAETPLHNMQLEMQSLFPDLSFKCVICDVSNKKRLEDLIRKDLIDVIYHAAAYKHVPLMEENPQEAVGVNIVGTRNLANLAVQYRVGHFVMVSTDKAVNPTNVMGASKRAAEMYVQSLSKWQKENIGVTSFITTRFGNVLGSNGSVVPLFRKQIENKEPITITHPSIIRYFMTIPEACQLVLEAGAMGKGGEIFIFDMGEPVKILDLAIKMIKLAGYTPNQEIEIKITGLRPGEKLYEELLSDKTRTLPTHHQKIMITRDQVKDYQEVNQAIELIIKAAKSSEPKKVVMRLKQLIPEFQSSNVNFKMLDEKKEGTVSSPPNVIARKSG